jgi:GntR family transcriptional regulator
MSRSELTLAVDLDSSVPVYRQIADEIRALVAQGMLGDGDELPSVRRLGAMVGVNQNTVANSYRQLAAEGLVELRHGSGARVRLPAHPYRGAAAAGDNERRLHDVISRLVLAGSSRKEIQRILAEAVERFFARPEGEG